MLLLKPLSKISQDFHLCGLNVQSEFFKSRLRVNGTAKWNQVIKVRYPGIQIPGTVFHSDASSSLLQSRKNNFPQRANMRTERKYPSLSFRRRFKPTQRRQIEPVVKMINSKMINSKMINSKITITGLPVPNLLNTGVFFK